MSTVVVGIGQPMAGDDGVGIAVARALAARGIAVRETTDASLVLSLLAEDTDVVVVDAVVDAGEPGTILDLDAAALEAGAAPLSSHGVGVAEAIELARALYGDAAARRIAVVGICVARPTGISGALSPAAAGAVSRAAAHVESIVTARARARATP